MLTQLMAALCVILALAAVSANAVPAPVKPQDSKFKIHARTTFDVYRRSVAVKSAEQLSLVTPSNGTAKQIAAGLARQLRVESIDWAKQMVIIIYGGEQRTGGYSVELKELRVNDGKLVVHWQLKKPEPNAVVAQVLTHPTLVILVDRFEGDIVFDPAAKE